MTIGILIAIAILFIMDGVTNRAILQLNDRIDRLNKELIKLGKEIKK